MPNQRDASLPISAALHSFTQAQGIRVIGSMGPTVVFTRSMKAGRRRRGWSVSKGKLFVTSGADGDRPRFSAAVRGLLLVLPLLLGQVPAAQAEVSVAIGIEMPGVSIGINLPTFPDLQRVPGYPVYYAPYAPGNYFYYDGLYWVFQGDDWYASSWYNGPWQRVMPLYVPAYVLRVPVYYYRQPPPYFRHWRSDAPPRWDQHWGREWQQRRPGWDHWDRLAAPPPAPLPTYQRRYPQSRYPQESARQQAIRAENFNYRPREPVSRQADQRPDRSPQHQQGRPPQPTQTRPAPAQASTALPPPPSGHRPDAQQPPRQQDRPPAAPPSHAPRQQAAPQDRGHPQGRAEPSNPRQSRKGDDPWSDRSPQHQKVRPVQQTETRPASTQAPRAQPSPQPRSQPNAQHPPRQQDRPQAAHPSHAPRPNAAAQDPDQPHGRAQTSHRRPDKLG
jgi:hypothetical protein